MRYLTKVVETYRLANEQEVEERRAEKGIHDRHAQEIEDEDEENRNKIKEGKRHALFPPSFFFAI